MCTADLSILLNNVTANYGDSIPITGLTLLLPERFSRLTGLLNVLAGDDGIIYISDLSYTFNCICESYMFQS